jgi:hypothetical protein
VFEGGGKGIHKNRKQIIYIFIWIEYA